jgi:hypothetical protein
MSAEKKEMGPIGRLIGIYISPKETFESIDRKPTWLIPFVILVVVVLAFQMLTMDIQLDYRLQMMEAQGVPSERIDLAQQQMQGPMKYIGLVMAPVGILVIWVIIAAIFLFFGKTIMGGDTSFKKVYSVIAWTGVLGILGMVVRTFLVLSKGAFHGVTTSLAMLLPTPPIGETGSLLYRILSKFDIFTIWQEILWIIGFAVIYRFTTKKSAIMVLSIWAVWIVISVALGGLFQNFGM